MDTTIKVDSQVRDRLAVLAHERGTSVRDLVTDLAANLPTRGELAASHAEAVDYLPTHVCPDLSDADLGAGERFWSALEARDGRRPGDPAAS